MINQALIGFILFCVAVIASVTIVPWGNWP